MRIINQYVSFMCEKYYFHWRGDEIAMKSTCDEDAIKEGQKMLFDLECD